MNKRATEVRKPYEELEFRDNFMFGRVMQDKELCREVLECLLQQPVGELSEPVSEKEVRHTSDGKYIRFDIYTRDEETVYDAEMQNLNNKSVDSLELPRRTRYYQAVIDTDHLNKGGNYRFLPDSAILYICTFDPFGRNLSKYTFVGACREDRDLTINDGAVRIFYNCTYKGDDISDELRKLYDYVENGVVGNELTKHIDGAVKKARKVEGWRSEYMFYDINLMDAKYEGQVEGLEQGREEGRKEERAKTEAERRRADAEQKRADAAEAQVKELKALLANDALEELAKYKEKYGEIV